MSNSLIDQKTTECPICGDFKLAHDEYCRGCEEWKRNADNLKKARARRRAFGDLL